MTSFTHNASLETSTLSELLRIYNGLTPDRFLGCYAYATQSGFRAFELAFGNDFWQSTSSRWLFGIDYGRTDPRALREIAGRVNTDVRIFDGAWVVNQEGFLPRRDFHPKLAIMENSATKASGVVLGSGNFSYNGLRRSVEAGTASIAKTKQEFKDQILPVKDAFENFWQSSTPLLDVLDTYALRKAELSSESDSKKPKISKNTGNIFWIEAGYVTKNRGDASPGNQTFFPKGFREFFGFKVKQNEKKNSIIGSITFRTVVGPSVTNNLRLNANSMEKISLPIPETHGFGVYDGKILVFERTGNEFLMKVFEAIEFEALYGDRLVGVKRMSGGRRYGAIV